MSSDGKHVQRLRAALTPVHESTEFPPREFRATQADVRDLRELIEEYDELRAKLDRHIAALELRREIDKCHL